MPRFERSITVNCPPQKAYDYLADISHHPELSQRSLATEKTSADHRRQRHRTTPPATRWAHTGVVDPELVPNQKIVQVQRRHR